jgi:hypothetical protein
MTDRKGGMMMSAGCRGSLRWGVPLVLCLLAVGPIMAEEVRVRVVAIIATERNATVDPKLTCVAAEVQKTYPKLTGFRLEKVSCKSLAIGAKEEFKLIDDEVATVTIRQPADKDHRVELSVKPPRMAAITYRTACHKCFPILTPYRNRDNDVLIIAVQLPCPNEK